MDSDMDEKNELETELFHIGLILLTAGIGGLAAYHFWIRGLLPAVPCFFSSMLGIYCPGCGGTRAVEALLHGRVLRSVWYHPLVPYFAVIGGGFMLTQGLSRLGVKGIRGWRFHNWYLYGAIIIAAGNFFVKNMLRLIWGITM